MSQRIRGNEWRKKDWLKEWISRVAVIRETWDKSEPVSLFRIVREGNLIQFSWTVISWVIVLGSGNAKRNKTPFLSSRAYHTAVEADSNKIISYNMLWLQVWWKNSVMLSKTQAFPIFLLCSPEHISLLSTCLLPQGYKMVATEPPTIVFKAENKKAKEKMGLHFFKKILFIYSWNTHTHTHTHTEAEGEAGSMQEARCGTPFQDSRIMPWVKGKRSTTEPPRFP